jgi:Flp pilus assembly pilin Flp
MTNIVFSFIRDERGQDLIEYGLLIGVITAACVVSIQAIGPIVAGYFSTLLANLQA